MPKTTHRLTAISASNIKKPGLYPDGAGLYLRVKPSGSRSWVFRYMHDRKPRYLGLGSAASVSLATARSLAGDARCQLDLGEDPIEARRLAEREAAADKARSMTFKQCAEAYMAAHEPSWKNAKHREQWHSTLRRYLYPKFGGVPVSTVSTEMVLDALQPIWHAMPETARKVRGRIESSSIGQRREELSQARTQPAGAAISPTCCRSRRRSPRSSITPALPFDELPAFISDLRARTGLSAALSSSSFSRRSGRTEALGARWEEFDLERTVWTVPAVRMKGSKEHRVPLSARAVEIIKELEAVKRSEFVFPGAKAGEASQQYEYVDASSPDEPRRPYRSRFPIDLPRLGRRDDATFAGDLRSSAGSYCWERSRASL